MTTVYPASEDNFSRPTPSSSLSGHAALHDDLADAIEAIENKVGVDNDTNTASHDYKIAQLESAPPSHNHGDLYYTETEVDGLLASKQNSSTALTTSTTFGGDVSGTYNNIQVSSSGHNHDDRYYTESEVNTSFAGVGHGHTSFSSDVSFTSATGIYSDSAAIQVTGSGASIALRANGAASNSSPCVQMRSGQNGGDLRAMLYVTQHDGASMADITCHRLYYNGGNVGSSRTIKENIVPAFAADNYDAVELVKQLDTSTFNYIDGSPDDVQLGLIAEDVFEVAPDFIELRDGTPRYLKQSIHFLTLAALRQAVTKIETLEARIAQLGG